MMKGPLLVVVAGLDGGEVSQHKLEIGSNLSQQIMSLSSDRFGGQAVYVFRNSLSMDNLIPTEVVPTIAIEEDDFYLLRVTPSQQAIIPILTAVAFAAVTYATAGLGAALLVGGLTLAGGLAGTLIPQPKLPTSQTNRDQASGLNALGTPTNVARIGSRVSEIFGTMRVWPDLAIPSLEDWSGRFQRVTCLYCVGVGYYTLTSEKLGETLIGNLDGVDIQVIPPLTPLIDDLGDPYRVGRAAETQQQIDLDATSETGGTFSAWIAATGDSVVELWIDIGFPSGLVVYKSSGGNRSETTAIEVEYQRTDLDDQPVHSTQFTFTSDTGNTLRYTVKVLGLQGGSYRCRVRRLDDGTHGDDDVHVSDCNVLKVVGVELLSTTSSNTYGNTFVRLVIDNNDQVAQLSALTFNGVFRRQLFTMGSSVDLISTTRDGTSWMRDALYYVLSDPRLGNFSNDDIDLEGIYNMHIKLKDLDGGEGGEFNGVFDRWTSVDEMAQAIANVGRCGVVYDGGHVIVIRDEDSPAPVSVFNRRVRPVDDQSTRVSQFITPDEEDGVTIDWFDSDNAYVPRTYIYPTSAINPKTVNLAGATHWSQVYRRAIYEMARLRYRRRSQTVQVTQEGLICNPMDIVTVIDPWLDPITDGDIIDYDPDNRVVTLDQAVGTSGGRVIRVRNVTGDLTDDIPVVPQRVPSINVTLTRDPAFTIVPRDTGHQVGCLYVLGTIGYLDQHDWHVLKVNAQDRKVVSLDLVEYSSRVFDCDTLIVPSAPDFRSPPPPPVLVSPPPPPPGPPPPPPSPPPPPPPPSGSEPLIGVRTETTSGYESWETKMLQGNRRCEIIGTFLPHSAPSNITTGLNTSLYTDIYNDGRQVSISVPMAFDSQSPYGWISDMLGTSFDKYYAGTGSLGRRLKSIGWTTPIFRLGWEAQKEPGFPWSMCVDFNYSNHADSSNFQRWVAVFQKLAGLLKDELPDCLIEMCYFTGPRIPAKRADGTFDGSTFVYYPHPDECYPGNTYVDIISTDCYAKKDLAITSDAVNNFFPTTENVNHAGTAIPRGPHAWYNYCRSKGKIYACPEWGVRNNQDNYWWVYWMWHYMRNDWKDHFMYNYYFNAQDSKLLGGVQPASYPNTVQEYKDTFGAAPGDF